METKETLIAKHPELIHEGERSATMAAKNIRIELKRAFPGVKFSVRTSYFSMGNSIDVSWEDGPTDKEVDAIVYKYRGGSFDGMTDCYNYSSTAWTAAFGSTKYLSTHRKYSDGFIAKVIAALKAELRSKPERTANGRGVQAWRGLEYFTDGEL